MFLFQIFFMGDFNFKCHDQTTSFELIFMDKFITPKILKH